VSTTAESLARGTRTLVNLMLWQSDWHARAWPE